VGEELFKNFSDINHLKQQAIQANLSQNPLFQPFQDAGKTQTRPQNKTETQKTSPKKQ
jgi:hypothetical protein